MRVDNRDQRMTRPAPAHATLCSLGQLIGPRSVLAAMLLALATLLALPTSAARAQDAAPAAEPEAEIGATDAQRVARELDRFGLSLASIDPGLTGSMIAERWNPFRLNFVNGPDALEGLVRLTFPQDQTQRAVVDVPIVARSGARVSVTAMINPSQMLDAIEVEVFRDGGRVYSTRIENFSDDSLSLGRIEPEAQPHVGVLAGTRSGWSIAVNRVLPIPRSSEEGGIPSGARTDGRGQNSEPDVPATSLRAANLPTAGMAFDGLWLLIVDADQAESLDEPRLRAVREWVLTGGRLVIVADSPGANWSRWLPRDIAAGITLGETLRAAPPGEVLAAMSDDPDRVRRGNDSLPMRRIRLNSAASVLRPWKSSLAVDGGEFLMVSGPAGLGAVMLLGFDPARVPASVDADASALLWRRAVREIIERQPPTEVDRPWMSVGASQESDALNSAIERISRVPEVGYMPFIAVGVIFVGLIVMLGPVDYFVLGRLKRRQWSLATAALWIIIAGAIATVAPSLLIRTDQTLSDRVELIDAVIPGGDTPSLGVRSGITAVFSNASQRAGVENYAAGTWVHGVAPGSFYGNASMLTPSAMFTQRLGVVGAASAEWGIALPEAAAGQGPRTDSDRPGVLPNRVLTQLRQWSLRCFADRGLVPAPRGSIVREGDKLVVRLSGLPAGMTLSRYALITQNTGSWVGADSREPLQVDSRGALTLRAGIPTSPASLSVDGTLDEAMLARFAGASGRRSALAAYARADGWAVLVLSAQHSPADDTTPTVVRGADTRVLREYRLAIPIGVNAPRGDQP